MVAKLTKLFVFLVLLELFLIPALVTVLLTKWGMSTIVSVGQAACRSCWAVLFRKRVAVSAEAAAAAAAAHAAAELGPDTPMGSPVGDEVSSPRVGGAFPLGGAVEPAGKSR